MASFSVKTFFVLAIAYLSLGTNGAIIPGHNDDSELITRADSSKVFVLDFDVKPASSNATISKKAGYLPLALADQGYGYYANLYLGSNKQKVTVQIDTGSSDLWVYDESVKAAAQGTGYYSPKQSKTYQFLTSGFSIEYVDKTGATGNWVKDTVTVGTPNGVSVPAFTFADATQTSVKAGSVFGIGYDANESSSFTYHAFPHALKDNGIIDKIAYSLYLNAPGAQSGTVIFGGIDTAKYYGQLVKIPNDVSDQAELALPLNSISYGGNSYSINAPGVLDSGTSFTYLPTTVVDPYKKKYFSQSQFDGSQGVYYVNGQCPPAADIKFNFNGVSITVPQNDILVYINNRCELHLIGNEDEPDVVWLLGDTFLRHAYVYYDLEDKTISLAQVKYTSASNIVSV